MNSLSKTVLVALVLTMSICAYTYSKYKVVVERNDKRYILETRSGRVWEIGETLLHSSLYTALDSLVPWGTTLQFLPNESDAQFIGHIQLAEASEACKRLVPEQIACMVENSSATEDIIVDYTKYTWPQTPTPFAKIVETIRMKVQRPSDDLPFIFSVRAAVIHRPADKNSGWKIEEIGPAVAFQGKGAAYFARAVGIVTPNIWEFYER